MQSLFPRVNRYWRSFDRRIERRRGRGLEGLGRRESDAQLRLWQFPLEHKCHALDEGNLTVQNAVYREFGWVLCV